MPTKGNSKKQFQIVEFRKHKEGLIIWGGGLTAIENSDFCFFVFKQVLSVCENHYLFSYSDYLNQTRGNNFQFLESTKCNMTSTRLRLKEKLSTAVPKRALMIPRQICLT